MTTPAILSLPGTTTSQMQRAPQGSVYVWVNSRLDYPRQLANHIGRGDLQIVSPDWIHPRNCCGVYIHVTIDHAAISKLTREQWLEVNTLNARAYRTPDQRDAK